MHKRQIENLEEFSATYFSTGDAYLRSAREVLSNLLQSEDLLSGTAIERPVDTYSRNLLFGDGRMSLWALVWAPGAVTSIHDHHCSCCFGVLSGSIQETWFDAIRDDLVIRTATRARSPGFVAAMLPSGPNIHQMANIGDQQAISIHLYGYDHRVRTSSVHREYNVAQACDVALSLPGLGSQSAVQWAISGDSHEELG